MATPTPPAFGVLFPGTPAGFPILSSAFTAASPTHFTLDVAAALGPAAAPAARDVVLFLASPGALPPGSALGLYVASPTGGGGWEFRGCVHEGRPSEVLPLSWPAPVGAAAAAAAAAAVVPGAFAALPPPPPGSAPGSAVLGVALEPLAEAVAKEGARSAARAEFGRAVGRDAFRFLESFAAAGAAAGAAAMADGEPGLLIPASAVDRWYARFCDRLARDPDWLTRRQE